MRRLIAALSASAAFVAVLPGTATAAPSRPAPTGTAGQHVTLITGDRITVHEGDRLELKRGPGREHIRFATQRHDGHVSVIPSDAAPLVRAGRVDPRLFDLTTLIEFGYDDRRTDLPLIVQGGVSGARATRTLPGGMSAVRADRAGEAWRSLTASTTARQAGASKIWLDGVVQPSLDVSVPQIGAPAAWEAGLDGAGATVAVLDSGVDETHPDLSGQVTAAQNFTEGEEDDQDRSGHGTHVASTIAGTGAASGGRYRGVAPGAKLLDGKVCVTFGCAESWILAGMQWAAEQGADVVNMSLGGTDTPGLDPMEEAVQTLTEQYGTLFVIAAGNAGGDRTVGTPASADSALAVGAVDRNDDLAAFSSRGPRTGDSALKPEITAPGVDIVAAKSTTGVIDNPAPVDGYTTLSGTSMATPHVAGAAAILAQQHPDWTADLLKSTLTGSAKPNPEIAVTAQGAGRVDVARAITQTVTSSPAALSFGIQQWPHADDVPRTETLTYRNSGTADVTLSLSVTPVPDGLVTFSAQTVTVPAGGTGSVTVTVDTSREMPDAFHGGQITATAGDLVVRTPFGVEREVESYDVKLDVRGRDGAPGEGFLTFVDLERRTGVEALLPATEVRLPKGDYAVVALLFGPEEDGAPLEMTLAAQGRFTVDGAKSLTIDARQAEPVSVTVPNPEAAPSLVELTVGGPFFGIGAAAASFDDLYSLHVGPDAAVEGITSYISTTFGKKDAEGTFGNSPFSYSLFYLHEGGLPTGFARTARQEDLATVTATHLKQATTADSGAKSAYPVHPAIPGGFFTFVNYTTLPFTRTEYYNADHGVEWVPVFVETTDGGAEDLFLEYGTKTGYRPGRTVTEQWNKAVFGPAFPDPGFALAGRAGDLIVAGVPLFGDGAGREGYSAALTSAATRLYRGDQLVGETADVGGQFEVPADSAAYRIEMSATRGAPHRLSTSVSASWTFTSGHTAEDELVPLPLSAVVFSPPVNDDSVAPKGRAFSVPLRVDPQERSAAARNRALTVEASFDDGATWRRVPVRDGAAVLRHPDAAGFVSLRAAAVDRAGNTVTQTVIRAYEIR